MQRTDFQAFQKLLTEVYECYGSRPPSPQAMVHWCDALHSYPFHNVDKVLRNWLQTQKKAPVIADITRPCADLLSDSIEARAAADKKAFEVKPEEWTGPTPFAEKCIAQMKAMLAKPNPPSKEWARKIIANPNATQFQREFVRGVLPRERERVPGEDDEPLAEAA